MGNCAMRGDYNLLKVSGIERGGGRQPGADGTAERGESKRKEKQTLNGTQKRRNNLIKAD